MELKIARVSTAWAYATVWKPTYDLAVEGFEERWWDTDVRNGSPRRDEFFRWSIDCKEVARAHVTLDASVEGESRGITRMPERVHDVTFLEVHQDFRLRGIGQEVVKQLEAC